MAIPEVSSSLLYLIIYGVSIMFVERERSGFYTTRFGRSDPALARQRRVSRGPDEKMNRMFLVRPTKRTPMMVEQDVLDDDGRIGSLFNLDCSGIHDTSLMLLCKRSFVE